jgi:small subunit ribosomal protein S9
VSEENGSVDNPTPTPTAPDQPQPQQRKEKPPVFMNKKRAYLGTGRRKTAVARVFLTEGTGKITINHRPMEEYFTEAKDRNAVVGPMALTDMQTRLDAFINVTGGGFTGQSGACNQGVARALKSMFGLQTKKTGDDGAAADEAIETMGKKLRDSGFLTRDGRMKERKKYGRKGARKSFQFSKR